MHENEGELTAFGRWLKGQPKGALSEAHRRTKLAWSTVCDARKKRMSREVARKLSRFTRGEVSVDDIAHLPKSSRSIVSASGDA